MTKKPQNIDIDAVRADDGDTSLSQSFCISNMLQTFGIAIKVVVNHAGLRQYAFGGVCQQAAVAEYVHDGPACSIIGDVLLQHGDKVFEEIALLSSKGQGCFFVGFHVCDFEYCLCLSVLKGTLYLMGH